ncbi:MAG: endonuclease III [Nanoarchaeota archaeon]
MEKHIESIMKILKSHYPSTEKTTLNRMRSNPEAFKILISCLLSLRAQDKNTEIVSKKLFEVADTPQEILNLSMKQLEKLIYSSGYYRNKARTIKHVSEVILKDYNGKVPDTREELMSINGIGPKTANIVLAFAYGKKVIPVDVHVHVISNRLGWVKAKTPEKTEEGLERILPKKYWRDFNAIFVQFGKDICVTLSPKCSICPISKYCPKIGVGKRR